MIRILDNFFDEDQYSKIIHHIKNKIYFTPRYYNNSSDKTEDSHYGNRFELGKDKNLYTAFVKQAEKKFKIKIHETYDDGIDLRNMFRFDPHIDAAKMNILIMLDGPIGVTTGTVFYTDGELDMHVGFRPNRAVMFPSDRYHSPHKSDIQNLKRYTATLFVREYEELV
jgi:hypothetical protein